VSTAVRLRKRAQSLVVADGGCSGPATRVQVEQISRLWRKSRRSRNCTPRLAATDFSPSEICRTTELRAQVASLS
jgi:hypothetical protein